MRVFTLCLSFLAAVLVGVQSEFTARRGTVGDCPPPDEARIAALLPLSFELGDGAPVPIITITDFNIVCRSPGLTRGTIGSFSVIVSYNCAVNTAVCGGSSVTDQFQYDCNADNTFTMAAIVNGGVRTIDQVGNLTTPLATNCGVCVDPSNFVVPSDTVTHCGRCLSNVCNEGQRECVAVDVTSQFCCNWYLEDRCVVTCPGNLTGDDTNSMYNCGCGSLELEFGTIVFSNRFAVGSVATHTCDESLGYQLSSESSQRTCDATIEGWTGVNITCILKDCKAEGISRPQNGMILVTSSTFGSVANFSCDAGFTLTGDQQRTCELDGWSGSNPTCVEVPMTTASATEAESSSSCSTTCIVGIVVAILAAVIIAAVVAAVAYAIYSYKTNPDTKLAKLDPNGINGVARDNPLYVEPEAVVEATDTAEAA